MTLFFSQLILRVELYRDEWVAILRAKLYRDEWVAILKATLF